MFTVYALYSEKFDKIYIGFTSDLQKRLISHNELGTKGWTIKFRKSKLSFIYPSDTPHFQECLRLLNRR
ncbi:MAG: GIY-YIG nuclease family protein [Cyclobacterium sp.]|uniref:GIY-YIG nuclease family protein n=1 Tax=unclassified Cyclobacterium TaxID=2615055 RepID=UPI0013D3C837|nr:GIY-YIG nuclease family protein [Cyclobacterium sp. SYSU L10401]